MAKNQHLHLEERIKIENGLDNRRSFKAIGKEIGKDCTTISKEVKKHLTFKKTGSHGMCHNSCRHRFSCECRLLCYPCLAKRSYSFCKYCDLCNRKCPEYAEEVCNLLKKAPYVCNGCESRSKCTLEKRFYRASYAQGEYKELLSEARSGISLSEAEVKSLDSVVSPLIMRGQSLNHICANNKDSIMLSESTLYRYVDYNLFSARNLDLPRKVRYRPRKIAKQHKVDKACRVGRDYQDFWAFRGENPDLPLTEMDSVIGRVGGKVLLTIHFVQSEFMLAFIRDANDSRSVIDAFNALCSKLGLETFKRIMPLVLTDNGSEFTNPAALEFDGRNMRRTHVFYCDPNSSFQKGSAEKNHGFIRCFIPKGVSMDPYSQADISRMMNHINSYCRESLGNKCPHDVFAFMYGEGILEALGCAKIPPNEVTLKPSVLHKGGAPLC